VKQTKVASYIIEGTLSEKQVEADVAAYLGWCSTGLPLRLLDVDEQLTGADKCLNIAFPLFINFKKSTGLTPLQKEILKPRANQSALQGIRTFRYKNRLGDNPTLFFKLRAKSTTAVDFQHNILMQYNQAPHARALYVAPLELDKYRYYELLSSGPRYVAPYFWKRHVIHERNISMLFDFQPFLKNHVSIPPHEKVSTCEHFFAYSQTGDDITWHSPSIISRAPMRLSDFLSNQARIILQDAERMPTPEETSGLVEGIIRGLGYSPDDILKGDTPLDRLQAHGRWLRDTHDIRQFLFLGSQKVIADYTREGIVV
jgi:hypothetical protein